MGGVVGGVQVALDADLVAAVRKREQAAEGHGGDGRVMAGQGAAVDEGRAPLALHVTAPAVPIVGVGVGVAAEPQVDRAGVGG